MSCLPISFDDSLRVGKFGPFAIGDPRDDVSERLDGVDHAEIVGRKRTGCIWLYGEIEFHFHLDRLVLVHCDRGSLFEGGKSLKVRSKKFRAGMSLTEATAILHGRNIAFRAHPRLDFADQKTLVLPGGFQLGFVIDPDADLGQTGFRSWSLGPEV
jgi:hypothetical protein